MKRYVLGCRIIVVALAYHMLALGLCPAWAQMTAYVSLDGDNSSGSSWATAFNTIAAGIAHAVGPTNVVLVSNGVYNVSAQIYVSSAITLTSLNGRAWTSINGGGITRCLHLNHADAVVDGFTISNGLAESTSYNDSGGGVRLTRGLLRNCEVRDNIANRYGGGVCFDQVSTNATVLDCIIANNQTTNTDTYSFGGGIYLQGTGSIVRGAKIAGNTALLRGGGIFATRGQNLLIADCIVSNNTSTGVFIDNSWPLSGVLVTNCNVVNNSLVGVYFAYGAGGTVIDSTISHNARGIMFNGTTNFVALAKNCMIFNNSNATDVCGGVYFNQAGTAQNCMIVSNYSNYDGGGVYMTRGGRLLNCLVAQNTANPAGRYGGGVLMHTMNLDNGSGISACTIVGNTARNGGGLSFFVSTNTDFVVNSIIASNTASVSGNDLYDYATQSSNAFFHSCIQVASLAQGKNNITNRDPQFVSSATDDFRLQANSPCINAGINQMGWMAGAEDLDGYSRIDRYSGIVDMGCYEYRIAGTMIMLR